MLRLSFYHVSFLETVHCGRGHLSRECVPYATLRPATALTLKPSNGTLQIDSQGCGLVPPLGFGLQ